MSKKIILGVTGSVAAKLTPKLAKQLIESHYEIKIIATNPGLYFFNRSDISDIIPILTDKEEWPEGGYQKESRVPHIDLGDWANILLIAPLTANTLAKMANGLCDNFLACVIRAWPKEKPLIIAPAMNTRMWDDSITEEHINKLRERFKRLIVVGPAIGRLACGSEGMGIMADIKDIVAIINKEA